MIAEHWNNIVNALKGAGYILAKDETSLQDQRYTLVLPQMLSSPQQSTFARQFVEREVRVRLQFKAANSASQHLVMAQAVEKVIASIRPLRLTFKSCTGIERPGGYVQELVFTVPDTIAL